MELTGKQRRHLRSLSNRLSATIQIGKGGVTEALVKNLAEQFAHHELIKLTVNQNCEQPAKALIEPLTNALGAHWVQTIGRTIVLYRPLEEPEIELPA